MGTEHYFAGDERSNRQRMLDGDFYISDDPDSFALHWRAVSLQARYAAEYAKDNEAARATLVELLGHLGFEAHVKAPLWVDYGSNIHIGDRTFVNYGLTALDVAEIRIGADCQIGPHVQLLTPTHPVDAQARRDRLEAARPIVLADNVWIGGGAIILAGVTIGENSVIGAGAVVTKDIPANVVALGNPARITKEL